MYWLTTRLYNPMLRRFMSPDDVGYLGANGDINSYNLYAYCSNDPVNYVDPSGHSVIASVLIASLLSGGFELLSQLVSNDWDFTSVHWETVIVATVINGISAACPAPTGWFVSVVGDALNNILTQGLKTGTFDVLQFLYATVGSMASNGIGLGISKLTKIIGGKIAVSNLSKKSPGLIKKTVLSVMDVPGSDRNKIKHLNAIIEKGTIYEKLPEKLLGNAIPQLFDSAFSGLSSNIVNTFVR